MGGQTSAVASSRRPEPAGMDAKATSEPNAMPATLPNQARVRECYDSTPCQVCIAILIAGNFIANVVEKEIDPDAVFHTDIFHAIECTFNIIFLLELLLNMYSHWFCEFWKSSWNIFDVIVVSLGLLTMLVELPPSFGLVRMVRAFRIFRLFRRWKTLNKVVNTILLAIPGMMHALLILTIVMSIFAILAVDFFKDTSSHGREYFGTFSKSLYSFFQVMTGDSWSEAIVRPTIKDIGSPALAAASSFYFVFYVLVSATVMVNVLVALLLDKMIDPDDKGQASPKSEGDTESQKGDIESQTSSVETAPAAAGGSTCPSMELRLDRMEQMIAGLVRSQEMANSQFVESKNDAARIEAMLAGIKGQLVQSTSEPSIESLA